MLVLIAPPLATYTWRGWLRPSVETIVPSGMKMLATLTASSSSPPPFSRRSRISALAPCASTLLTCRLSSAPDPSVKLVNCT